MLTEREIEHIIGRIADRLDPERIVIFGSYAKGTATARSDLDLLIVHHTDQPEWRRADELGTLISHLAVRVDVHVATPEEVDAYSLDPHSFLSCALRGRLVYSRGTRRVIPLADLDPDRVAPGGVRLFDRPAIGPRPRHE